MARHVEGPWYRKSKDTWYATVSGRKLSLGIRGLEGRAAAQTAWHRLMAGMPNQPTEPVTVRAVNEASILTVRELCDLFLSDAATRLKPNTVRIYTNDLNSFCGTVGTVSSDKLTPLHVSRWLASLNVTCTTKAIMLRSVLACLNWAVRSEVIRDNPARRVPKPKGRSRSEEAVISDADHAKLLAAATPAFRTVLRVLHGTGARPGEVCAITSETFDPTTGLVKLTEHKTDHTGRPRLIFPPGDVVELLREQLARFGAGPLLRSRKGKPFTGRSVTKAMQYLRKKTGIKAIAYGYRHTFVTDALVNGVPDAHVAALVGHTSTAMIYRHYSHLGSRVDTLREAAAKVRGVLHFEKPATE